MVRLIDADALAKELMHEGLGYQYNRVINAPTVDAVPVIRCKDCKYFTRYKDCIEMYMWDGECSEWVSHTYLDWFCSRAERRNNVTVD